MWAWQGQQHQTQQQDSGQSNAQVAGQPQVTHAPQSGPGSQPQEFNEMLQMLQEHSGPPGFDELNMFNTNFE